VRTSVQTLASFLKDKSIVAEFIKILKKPEQFHD